MNQLGVIPDGAILCRNGVIEAVGPTRRIENLSDASKADEIDAAGRLVMPAFVDAHACLVPSPHHEIDAARALTALPATRLEAQANAMLKIIARHGTATIAAGSGHAAEPSAELKALRAMHACDSRPLDLVSFLSVKRSVWADEPTLRAVHRRKLARIVQARCGENGLALEQAESFLRDARRLGFMLRLDIAPGHAAATIEAAIRLDALSVTAGAALTIGEVESLACSSVFTILVPDRFTATGSQDYARRLIDSGGLVALGTGMCPESGGPASMQTVIQMACERLNLTLPEAVCAATRNSAWAIGQGSQTGSLEHGKRADFLLLNISDYREFAIFRGTNLVHSLVKRGVVVFEEEFRRWPAEA